MSDTDKKAIKARNELRANRIAHIHDCAVCRGWLVVDLEEGDAGVGGVGLLAVVGDVEAKQVVPEDHGLGHVGDVVGDVRDAGDARAGRSSGLRQAGGGDEKNGGDEAEICGANQNADLSG